MPSYREGCHLHAHALVSYLCLETFILFDDLAELYTTIAIITSATLDE